VVSVDRCIKLFRWPMYQLFLHTSRLLYLEMYISIHEIEVEMCISIQEIEKLKIPLHNIHTSNFVFTLSAFGLNQMELKRRHRKEDVKIKVHKECR
jgi:hypothetical protein